MYTMPLGEEAELADAHQAGGEHMQQEAAQELDGVNCQELGAGAVRVIFPFETDVTVFERTQAMVGDGDAWV